jgi:putative ABC transport system permease protein
MKAINRKLIGDLRHLRGPIIAVGLVVACGISMLVSMVSVYDSLGAMLDVYYTRYAFADLFATVRRAPRSLAPRLAAIDGVAAIEERIVTDVTLDVPGLSDPATGRLVSMPDEDRAFINGVHLRSGRFADRAQRDEIVASEAFASANHLRVGDAIGATINGRWRRLRIVGVGLSPEYLYEIGAGMVFPDNRRFGILWMRREALAAAFDMEGAFNDIALKLTRGADRREIIDRVDALLAPYGGLGAYCRDEHLSARTFSDELGGLIVFAIGLPVIFLGIAVFLLHTVLSRLIAMQRDQIAVLKAFGYASRTIAAHYLAISLVAVLIGAIIGVAGGLWLGNGLTTIYTTFYRFPIPLYVPGVRSIVLGLALSTVAAAIGALGAVRRASSMPAAEAMRPQAPEHFRPLLVERLGVQRLLSTSARMVFRNLERTPVKALVSIAGIACAIATLITGSYADDSLEVIRTLQFRTIQREDVVTVFAQARSRRSIEELRHMPGVMRVEPFRVAPARLRFEHRSRRIAITGLDERTELRRVVAGDGRVIALAADGVTMTSFLAGQLGIGRGDTIVLELLEGSRPTARVIVTELVDELLGVAVYMNRRTLDRIARSSESISGAYLRVDRGSTGALYDRLKRTPAVASTAIRQATIEGFEKMIAESQAMRRPIVAGFALVIAIGIVFNNLRISLSERGRELASLRVLGFTRREVAGLLFGEQAILILAALPVGHALGYALCWGIKVAYQTEMMRMPVTMSSASIAYATIVVAAAAVVSGAFIRRRLDRLDLVAVLKTRE